MVGAFDGASDLTRTGDLLITSANFAVFYRPVMWRKVLRCNDFLDLLLRIVLATGSLVSYLW
jgi:hypothetical protein